MLSLLRLAEMFDVLFVHGSTTTSSSPFRFASSSSIWDVIKRHYVVLWLLCCLICPKKTLTEKKIDVTFFISITH